MWGHLHSTAGTWYDASSVSAGLHATFSTAARLPITQDVQDRATAELLEKASGHLTEAHRSCCVGFSVDSCFAQRNRNKKEAPCLGQMVKLTRCKNRAAEVLFGFDSIKHLCLQARKGRTAGVAGSRCGAPVPSGHTQAAQLCLGPRLSCKQTAGPLGAGVLR